MGIADILKRIGNNLQGFRSVVLIGKDGFVVEKHGMNDASLEALVVEFLSLLNKFDSLLDERGDGPVSETTIRGNAINYFLTFVDENYILFLGVGNGENVGRCRFELKKASMDLRRELAE